MGRTLDSLRQGDGHRSGLVDGMIIGAGLVNSKPAKMEAEAGMDAEEFPFIEVGGSGKRLDGSPAVMSAPLPPKSAQPAVPVVSAFAPKQAMPFEGSMMSSPPAAPTMNAMPAGHAVVQVACAMPSLECPPPMVASASESRPMCVTFEPWPRAGSASRRVASEVVAYHQPNHPVSRQYALLFDKMMAGCEGRPQVLLFMGASAQAGTTTALLNLAFSGCDKRRLVLVDGNRRHPVLAERLGLATCPSLSDVVAGTASMEQAMHKTAHPHVQAITADVQKQGQPLRGESVQWMLAWLRDRFFVVLIDGPSLENTADMDALVSACDGMYLVMPQHGQQAPEPPAWAQSVAHMGGKLRGLIHTHF